MCFEVISSFFLYWQRFFTEIFPLSVQNTAVLTQKYMYEVYKRTGKDARYGKYMYFEVGSVLQILLMKNLDTNKASNMLS